MKHFLLFLSVLFLEFNAFAQGVVNNLVVFINESEPFTLIMNGERYNMTPQTRVRVTGLTLSKYSVKIVFTNPKFKDHNTTLTFFSTGWECEFVLNPRGKRKHRMDFFTQKRIEGFDQINSNGNSNENVTQTSSENSAPPVNTTNSGNNNQTSPVTHTISDQPITPTNTVLTGTGTFPKDNIPKAPVPKCETPLTQQQFEKYKNEILKKTTDSDKKILAFALIESHCLITSQVKQLIDVFVEDNVKLDVAKKAYNVTKDYSNYSKLTEAFLTSGVKDEFKKFLSVKK